MPVYERSEKILMVADAIKNHKEEFAQILSAEAGKPIQQARAEVERAIFTFTDAAEESKRIRGERMPLDLDAGSKGRWAIVNRFPIGVILGSLSRCDRSPPTQLPLGSHQDNAPK